MLTTLFFYYFINQLLNKRYISANAERLRDKFVRHEGQMELTAAINGTLHSANYDNLLDQLSTKIDQNTKVKKREREKREKEIEKERERKKR